MPISKKLQNKLDVYEQLYNSLDKPIPFKNDLMLYPVLVEDYYKFYNCFGCLTMDKTVKIIKNEKGEEEKIPNIEGIKQTYLDYLIVSMQSENVGPVLTAQVMDLFELVFHIEKGMYCPKCGNFLSYKDFFNGMDKYVNDFYNENIKNIIDDMKQNGNNIEEKDIPEKLRLLVKQSGKEKFLSERIKCKECEETLLDVFGIKQNGKHFNFVIKGTEINSNEFEEFKAIVPRQNIIDYDGDKYIDPELKEELEIKSQMQNKDYTAPTLEKQIVCVAIGTGFTFDYLHKIPMRKLSMLLRLIDKEKSYYAQYQASMSGMVEFKTPPEHWIFSDDKKNIAKELTSMDQFTKKFDMVV